MQLKQLMTEKTHVKALSLITCLPMEDSPSIPHWFVAVSGVVCKNSEYAGFMQSFIDAVKEGLTLHFLSHFGIKLWQVFVV